MKSFTLLFFLFILLIGCQRKDERSDNSDLDKTSKDTLNSTEKPNILPDSALKPANEKPILALTSNALQLVILLTGSTREISFGMPLDQMVALMDQVLELEVSNVGLNGECGAGPLTMATLSNGLTLVFQEDKTKNEWVFEGWYLGEVANSKATLTTIAGIGIGSTRAEMEDVTIIEVFESSLGQEFSTESGLYGVFSGTGKDAKITDLWSGISCIFR
ncbi:hypothetical protein P872_06935 [Rhodonellum psychrophilum GCM71 = DSM 17998]|uniref:Uncharacterized protein n=2 Tax=Rhodonellum TaxID=336827 RepID=U5BYZ5_9BACT|nr:MULTISPECIES: hypothetical protein [Rhodonellum]ERM81866.1 hypothetical protein P872_06935 [Rhodonellum psychrophilum GCM71 = DSM 17998]SDY67361.1 hypothetical protein SAMN05444412_102188 [Rhodonellum ikkaensis]